MIILKGNAYKSSLYKTIIKIDIIEKAKKLAKFSQTYIIIKISWK